MGIIIFLLNLLGIVCYLIAGFFAMLLVILFFASSNEDSSFKGGCITLILGVSFCIGGILIREYSESSEKRKDFFEVLENGNKDSVIAKFSQLDYSEQKDYINEIFEKFYNNTFQEKLRFVRDYQQTNLDYVEKKKVELEEDISKLYNNAENDNSIDSWRSFSKIVSDDIFINFASRELKDKEFSKWTDDENAWARTVALNTISMYREYLSHFPYGKYEDSARKIILDYDYSLKKEKPYKVTNYCGETTLQICNKSSQSIIFSYTGTFAEGEKNISGNNTIWITIPNGYYSIHVYSQNFRTRGDYSTETLDGGMKTLEYFIRQEYR